MILLVDNYDSFTYNLAQYLAELGARVQVWRNDAFTLDDVRQLGPEGILISPGPGDPDGAGRSLEVIDGFAGEIPILGVCLGHQAIGQYYGGSVVRAGRLMHGRTSSVTHDGKGVFTGLDNPLVATRYHSLILDPDRLPGVLEPTAWTDEGELMGLRHRTLPIEGVQFHPESFLTEQGHDLLGNWLRLLPGGRGGPREHERSPRSAA
jgi:anthranilate synthase component 2